MKTEKDDLAARFLLGKLTEEENTKIEKGYFSDKNHFEEILIAENELIDAYVTGNLSPEDKNRFESRLLLNRRQRQRVKFAETLVTYASTQSLAAENLASSPSKSSRISVISRLLSNKPMLSFAFAAAILIIFAGGVWLTFDQQTPRINQSDDLAAIQTPPQTPIHEATTEKGNSNVFVEDNKPEILPSPIKSNQPKPPQVKPETPPKKETPVIFSLIVSPGLTRDPGTSQRFTIPAKTDFVEMRLKFEWGDFSSYHAVLETVEGRQVWSSDKLKASKGKVVTVLIPSKLLKKSDYIITLKGATKEGVFERVEDYSFTINR